MDNGVICTNCGFRCVIEGTIYNTPCPKCLSHMLVKSEYNIGDNDKTIERLKKINGILTDERIIINNRMFILRLLEDKKRFRGML